MSLGEICWTSGVPPACALPVCRAGTGRHADRSRVSREGKASPSEARRGKYSPPASPERVTAEGVSEGIKGFT
ncbi:MAG: hypothetical protein ABID54_14500 [Pseudomonadota bacterium]